MRKKEADDPALVPSTSIDALLGELAQRSPLPSKSSRTWVAEVIDDRHPDVVGRVLVRWLDPAEPQAVTRWLPTLSGLPVRRGDRVTLQQPENWPEPIIFGVIDGYARREAERHGGAHIELRKDEAIEIRGHRGTPLVAIHEGESGPVVRILSKDLGIDVPGHLRLTGASLELRATDGSTEIEARDDVIVQAETIHLN
jgi:hypothetical protein